MVIIGQALCLLSWHLCWFCYVDDTFVIRHHGPEAVRSSLTMGTFSSLWTQRDSHLPFLDTNIYHKPDSSLGHKVHHKPMHTNIYFNSTNHHPSNRLYSLLVHKDRPLSG
ncbi:hypothetical protein L798_10827 [Zootermopsis nevadensis]|uniref:Secreted protein n=1 Tax=Zootermopsis nevadensis TaxID=136037 RepID=A0A067R9U8_ZOONE|nr:hypothetical protein L798_10827 [Zootermopsis nevadensis]